MTVEVLGADSVVYLAQSEVLDFETEDRYVNLSKSSATFFAGMRDINLRSPEVTVEYHTKVVPWEDMGLTAHIFGWKISRED